MQSEPGQIKREISRRTKTLVISLKSPVNIFWGQLSAVLFGHIFGNIRYVGNDELPCLRRIEFSFDIGILQLSKRCEYGFQSRYDLLFRSSEIVSHIPTEMKQIGIF